MKLKIVMFVVIAFSLGACGGSTDTASSSSSDDAAPNVSLTSSSSSISESSSSSITLTATLSQIADEAVTVSFSTSGTAASGTDYSPISSITIAAGSTTGTTSFTPIDDSIFEGDEVTTVAIASVSGGSATESGTQSVSITITGDDASLSFPANIELISD